MRLPCPPVPRTFQLVGCVLRDGRGVERAPCDPPADRRFSRLPVPDDDDSFHDQAARARLGTVLREKWRLERLLGAGGMGVVYAATHRNGKRVALKMLHPEFSGHPEVRARFVREGYVANSVDHRGVVSVLDDDVTDDGAAFLVMELLEGESIEQRWRRCGGVLAPTDVLSITDQLLDVLAAAHARGVVHRDIKPENVFLTREGVVKVLDFGIARMLELAGGSGTKTGTTMGTPAYMAPEQALGEIEKIGPQTDVYSVGAMMFALLSGELVHPGESSQKQVIFAATRQARSLGTAAPGLPAELVAVVDRALSFDRGARWPDARSMQQAVREAYAALTGAQEREEIASMPDPPSPPTVAIGHSGPRSQPSMAEPATPQPARLQAGASTTGGTETTRVADTARSEATDRAIRPASQRGWLGGLAALAVVAVVGAIAAAVALGGGSKPAAPASASAQAITIVPVDPPRLPTSVAASSSAPPAVAVVPAPPTAKAATPIPSAAAPKAAAKPAKPAARVSPD